MWDIYRESLYPSFRVREASCAMLRAPSDRSQNCPAMHRILRERCTRSSFSASVRADTARQLSFNDVAFLFLPVEIVEGTIAIGRARSAERKKGSDRIRGGSAWMKNKNVGYGGCIRVGWYKENKNSWARVRAMVRCRKVSFKMYAAKAEALLA